MSAARARHLKDPVFVVGMPRSGTTFLQRVLTEHPDLCTTTRATREFPTSAALCRLMRLLGKPDTPGEGGRMWDRFLRHDHDVMKAGDVTPKARPYYHAVRATHLELYERSRFLARYPANSMRIGFLREIFPDALFVHMIRDGRAVCHSVLRMRQKDGSAGEWWGVRPPNWRELEKLPPLESVAHQWVEVVRAIRDRAVELPPQSYMEIRYEDLAAAPATELRRFCRHCGLEERADLAESVATDMENRNYKWREAFSASEVETVAGIMGPTLRDFGYAEDTGRAV